MLFLSNQGIFPFKDNIMFAIIQNYYTINNDAIVCASLPVKISS